MLHTGRIGKKHLILAKQIAMIEGHGEVVQIFPCLTCSCLMNERDFDPICPVCHGTGRQYIPGTEYLTTMLLTRDMSQHMGLEPGEWLSGTIQASFLPDIVLADRDKVRRLDITETYADEVLTKGLDDTVRFSAGVRLHVVADRTQVYRPDIDYRLVAPNTVGWLPGGMAPVFGEKYSVKYDAYPEYLVVPVNPRLRVEHRQRQSQVVTLLRFDHVTEGM